MNHELRKANYSEARLTLPPSVSKLPEAKVFHYELNCNDSFSSTQKKEAPVS